MNINYKLLEKTCKRTIQDFAREGQVTKTPDGILIYRDNPKAKILAVAHLDYVVSLDHFYHLKLGKENVVFNGSLDDRLGVFTLLYLLPQLGIEYDLLLTEGEERGRSTAYYFKPTKDYNWVFSFDRRGQDVVLYQYEAKPIVKALTSARFTIGHGTFSDIVEFDDLGVSCFNVGTGYYSEHSNRHYAVMEELEAQINKFKTFYDKYQDTKFPYESIGYSPGATGLNSTSSYNHAYWKQSKRDYHYSPDNVGRVGRGDEWDEGGDFCDRCGRLKHIDDLLELGNGKFICEDCLSDYENCQGCDELVLSTNLMDGLCPRCMDSRTIHEDVNG